MLQSSQIILYKTSKSKSYGQGKENPRFSISSSLIRYFDAEDKNAIQITKWGVMLACILTIMVVEIADAFSRQTSAYVLAVGLVLLIFNEFRQSRSDSV